MTQTGIKLKQGLAVGDRLSATALFVLFGLVGLIALPLVALLVIAFGGQTEVWSHLLTYVLPRSAGETLLLLTLVAFGTTLLGAGTAWLTTMCRFPGRRIFQWALVLPLAVPAYIAAYAYVEFLDYSGPVQTFIRNVGGYGSAREYWFPDIQSVAGAALVFSVVLFPYVFLSSRLLFSMQGASALDASRVLGARPAKLFWKVGLPMARPALVAGVALALMEVLNDIGAVEILGVKTLSYAVFETWLNRDDLQGAVQLSLVVLLIVGLLIWIEKFARRGRSFATSTKERPPSLIELSSRKQAFCFILCAMPLIMGLGIPLWVLGQYAIRRIETFNDPNLLYATGNSVLVAAITASLATSIAYGLLQYARMKNRADIAQIGKLASLGYAVPGTVLAVGLLIPLAAFDNTVDGLMRNYAGVSTGLMISGTIAILVYACTLRFLAISYGTIEAGFSRISANVDLAARGLGQGPQFVALRVHRPMLSKVLAGAFLLVFVDTMKELSATLLLRPFGFETLATYVYDRASQSAVEEASIAALLIILVGLLPIFFLGRLTSNSAR